MVGSEGSNSIHQILAREGSPRVGEVYTIANFDLDKKNEKINIAELDKRSDDIAAILPYYSHLLYAINPATFSFLTREAKAVLTNQLRFTYYLISSQYLLDEARGRKHALPKHKDAMQLCLEFIARLQNTATVGEATNPEKMLAIELSYSDKLLKLLGMTIIAQWLVGKMQEFSTGKTGVIKDWLTEINIKRLYWVWGGGLLSSVLAMLPEDFFNNQQAQKSLATPTPVTGYMSWILYYTRFGINLFLLLKHTIRGPWMEETEKDIPAWDRFKTQWNQRKFALLNDSIWATANMVCFFWLKGGGMLGYGGNVLTVLLLVMDASLTAWRFWEESTKHNKEMLGFEQRKKELEKELYQAIGALEESQRHPSENTLHQQELEQKKAILEAQLAQLDKMIIKSDVDWKYKKYGLINDLVYALGLIIAFSLLCSFFFPPAAIVPAAAMILAVAGAALCFALTVAYAAISGGIEIAKSKNASKLARAECAELLEKFKAMEPPKEEDSPEIKANYENTRKLLYLDMKKLMADSEHQQRMANFQAIKLVRSILIDAFIPAVVFASLVFMPLGIGLAVLAAGLALAVISNIIINRFEPKPQELPAFNEEEFKRFSAQKEPSLAFFESQQSSSNGFFTQKTNKEGYTELPKDNEEGHGHDPNEVPVV